MSVLSIVLAVLLGLSVCGNVFQAFFGVRIEQNQTQHMQTYNINENANLNIVNGYSQNGDKLHFIAVQIESIEYLTNYLKTLDSFQCLYAEIIPMEKGMFLVWIPVIEAKTKTNLARMETIQSNAVKFGIMSR